MPRTNPKSLANVALQLHNHLQLLERIVSSLEGAQHELEDLTERERVGVCAGLAKTKMHINGLLVRLEAELARRRARRAKSPKGRVRRRSLSAAALQRLVALATRRRTGARGATRRGLRVLFLGPSRDGKTRAAEELATALDLDVHRIDVARVVSKYAGETEKNLARLFDAAERANWLLYFDEADALFGKRTEVKDAHDRYANVDVAQLLARIESCAGVVVLASNRRENLDPAYLRRLDFVIRVPASKSPRRRSRP